MENFFIDQRQIWGEVAVETVPGNHGRAGKFAHVAASWDIVAYRYLQKELRIRTGGKIEVGIQSSAVENKFLRKIMVRGHPVLLYHGHDIRSFANIPWYGMALRTIRWQSTKKLSPFELVLMGHFHTRGAWPINKFEILLSGSMITDDDWALQAFGWEGTPEWWLFGVSRRFPTTWSYRMKLDEE